MAAVVMVEVRVVARVAVARAAAAMVEARVVATVAVTEAATVEGTEVVRGGKHI